MAILQPVLLSLVWLAGGALVGLLGRAAGFTLPLGRQGGRQRAWVSGLGALAALGGGWLGAALFGVFFASPTAAWVAVLVVVAAPWLAAHLAPSASAAPATAEPSE